MFEFSVVRKYLVPRQRQLSASIIGLISILVISLVVWLVVVFFSVTQGLENSWTKKLIALTAPIRILPTSAYYQSYYYQSDLYSSASGYASKSIGEKLISETTDPYDPDVDSELPPSLKKPSEGPIQDIVKQTFASLISLSGVPKLQVNDFEISIGNLRLSLTHSAPTSKDSGQIIPVISQTIYVGSYNPNNNTLTHAIMPLTSAEMLSFTRTALGSISQLDPSLTTFFIQTQLLGPWLSAMPNTLPTDRLLGEAILVPKSFRNSGALVGNPGSIAYQAITVNGLQEQRLPVYIAGFYDPGILPMGGRFLFANPEFVSLMRSSAPTGEAASGNGIHVLFEDIQQADQVKKAIIQAFEREGLAPYWQVETYREYEFTKDLLQQLRSERNLWTLLATVIILVACSNIISMLIILVNDKKMEIGILRAMGATSASIAAIFGICGMVMGMAGSLLGLTAAYFTLQHLQKLVSWIGWIQGYEMFNPVFYGNTLPNEISFQAVLFVVLTTASISLVAGLIPAIKASLLHPAAVLRSE